MPSLLVGIRATGLNSPACVCLEPSAPFLDVAPSQGSSLAAVFSLPLARGPVTRGLLFYQARVSRGPQATGEELARPQPAVKMEVCQI